MLYFKYLLVFALCASACATVAHAQTQIAIAGTQTIRAQAGTTIPQATTRSTRISPPTTEDSVRAAVNELFTAMKNSDGARLQASFTDSALLQTIVTNKEGKTFARNESIQDFAASISKLPRGAADERIRFDVIKINGPLAIVWAPYSFYFKEKFSHCGIDSFQLLRSGGVWRILYIVDTRRKELCE